MLGLLFAGAKRDIDKKINSTVSCFLYRKKATVTNAAFEVQQICVILCRRCLQMKNRTGGAKKYDLF